MSNLTLVNDESYNNLKFQHLLYVKVAVETLEETCLRTKRKRRK